MMLLTIYTSDRCNLKCSYCLAARWNNKLEKFIPADLFLDYCEKYFPPKTTIIEHTGGGEPTTHPEFDYIISEQLKRGYKIILRTNGTNPVEKHKNLKIVSTWHKHESKYVPIESDYIIIPENYDDDVKVKKNYCAYKSIPYEVKQIKDYCLPKCQNVVDSRPRCNPLFSEWQVIFPDGTLAQCNKGERTGHICNGSPPKPKQSCYTCQPVINAEFFICRKWREDFRDSIGCLF